MSEQEFVELTVDFSNNSFDEKTLEDLTQVLYRKLSQMSEIQKIKRVLEPLPPDKKGEGEKPKPGWLEFLVSVGEENLKKVLQSICKLIESSPSKKSKSIKLKIEYKEFKFEYDCKIQEKIGE